MPEYVLIYDKQLNDSELELLKRNSSASSLSKIPNSDGTIKPLFTILEYLQLLNYPLACSAISLATDGSLLFLGINDKIKPIHIFINLDDLDDVIDEYVCLVEMFKYVKADKSTFSNSVFSYSSQFSDIFGRLPNLDWDNTLRMIADKIDADDELIKEYFLKEINKYRVNIK